MRLLNCVFNSCNFYPVHLRRIDEVRRASISQTGSDRGDDLEYLVEV